MNDTLCLIMLGGEAPGPLAERELWALLSEHPYVVAADGGAEHLLRLGLAPHLLAGDGDSLSMVAREACRNKGTEFVDLPREKDFTDAEAAFLAVSAAGYHRMAVFGAFGGRLDHLLGNLLLPLALRESWANCTFYGEGFTAYYSFGYSVLHGRPGDTVSLLALSATVNNITLRGFKYPLLNTNTTLGASLCISNELIENTGNITFDNGIMLIIHYSGQVR